MDWTHRLLGFLCGGVILLFTYALIWYLSGWKGTLDAATGDVLLRFNAPTRIMGVCLVALAVCFPVLMTLLIVVVPPEHLWEYAAAVGFAAFVAIASVYVWRETRHGCAVVSSEGIKRYSPWSGTTSLDWREVTRVEVGPCFVMAFWVHDTRRMVFPVYWTGLESLFEVVKRQLPPNLIVVRGP